MSKDAAREAIIDTLLEMVAADYTHQKMLGSPLVPPDDRYFAELQVRQARDNFGKALDAYVAIAVEARAHKEEA
jgi:hypothetical protein